MSTWFFVASIGTLAAPVAFADAPAPAVLELKGTEDTEVREALTTELVAKAPKPSVKTKPAHGAARMDGATLVYMPAHNFHGDDALVIDLNGGSTKVMVHIAEVNDAPTASPLALTVKEDSTVSGVIATRDVDGDSLHTVVETAPAHGVATVDEATGRVAYTPALDFNGADAFTLEVSDGQLSANAEVKVSVSAVNDAPVASAASFTVDEDAKLTGQLAATDVDNATLTFRVAAAPKHGALTVTASGAVTYVPVRDFHGADDFAFEVSDGSLTAHAAATITVNPLNDAPVAAAVSLVTTEDAPAKGAVLATDVDGDALTYSVKSGAAHGEAQVDAKSGKLTYLPVHDFSGADAFTVEVSDGQASVAVEVKVAVSAVNDAPVASAATFSLDEDAKLTAQLQATDVDNATLTYRVLTAPKHGALTISPTGALSYLPARDFHGVDELAFEVSDGALTSHAAVGLTVNAVNDAPVAATVSLTTTEDVAAKGAISAADVDGDVLTYSVKSGAAHGEAQVDAKSGKVTYLPARDFNGADAFTVEVSDGQASVPVEVKVAVAAVNDAPVASAASFSVDEDTKLTGQLQATDVDNATLAYRVLTAPKHGALTIGPTGASSYVPARDFHGADEFSFEVSDGALTSHAAVTLTVNAVNDAPVAKPLALSTAEDTAVKGTLLANDVDGDTLSYLLKTQPAHGVVELDAKTGQLRYTPSLNTNGADSFELEVSDGNASVQAVVAVTVAAVNDAPVAQVGAFSVNEDEKLEGQVSFSDVERDVLTVRVEAKPKHGELTLNPKTGAFSYQPARDYHGKDGFSFEVSDGALVSPLTAVSLEVVSVNDAPVTKSVALSTPEDTSVKGAVVAIDVDGDALSYRVSAPAAHGTASVDAKSGAVTFMPAPDFNGTDGFVVEVNDGAATASAQVSVTVTAVADAPRVSAATLETAEDTVGEGTLPGFDPDGDKLTFRLLSAPKLGEAVLLDAATGAWKLTPGHDLNGDDALAFEVTDGTTAVKGVMKIHVSPVNDAPVLANLELKSVEDQVAEGQLRGSDVDGDALKYVMLEQAKVGRATVDAATGKARFEAPKDWHGSASFTVAVSDGVLRSAPVVVQVEVQAQNDAPVAANAELSDDEDVPVRGVFHATDVDGDALTFVVSRAPAHGTVTVLDASKGTFEYLPAANYSGKDEFRFTASDGDAANATGVVALTIRPVDDPPVAMPDDLIAPASGSVTGRLRGYDRESPKLSFRIVDQPSGGRVKLDERTGDFVFTTDGVEAQQLAFQFVAFDGALSSKPAEVTVHIRARSF